MAGKEPQAERVGRALGHGAYALVASAVRALACAAVVAAPCVPIAIALGIFSPSSPLDARVLCAAVISLVTGCFWAAVALALARVASARCRTCRSARSPTRTESA